MRNRYTVILVAAFLLIIALVVSSVLIPNRNDGELEPYGGTSSGLKYAGAAGDEVVLFRYFNGRPQAVALKARDILREDEDKEGWVREPFTNPPVFRIPPHHALKFGLPAPDSDRPWRFTFEESEIRAPALRFGDRLRRLLGRPGSIPPFDGIIATPIMMGLEPKVEPSDPPNDGPATSVDNAGDSGGGRHR